MVNQMLHELNGNFYNYVSPFSKRPLSEPTRETPTSTQYGYQFKSQWLYFQSSSMLAAGKAAEGGPDPWAPVLM